jgi:hypothetical protein
MSRRLAPAARRTPIAWVTACSYQNACDNQMRIPVDAPNAAVLQDVEQHALTPEAVEAVIQLAERDVWPSADVNAKPTRTTSSVASRTCERPSKPAVRSQRWSSSRRPSEAKRATIADDIAALQPVPRLAPRVVENRLAEWRRLLRHSTTQGRMVLQRVLRGRITFMPRADGQGYDLEAKTRFDAHSRALASSGPRPCRTRRSAQTTSDHATRSITTTARCWNGSKRNSRKYEPTFRGLGIAGFA